MALLTRRQLEYIDTDIKRPRQGEFVGRKLISRKLIDEQAEEYTYKIISGAGKVKRGADDTTDIPIVGVDGTEAHQNVTTFQEGIAYTDAQLAKMARGSFDLVGEETAQLHTDFARGDDDLIFNGEPDMKIPGLLTNTDAQSATMSKPIATIDDPVKLVNELNDLRSNITSKVGFETAKPTLALPPNAYKTLQNQYNEYQSNTILKILTDNAWFESIIPIARLDSKIKETKLKNDAALMFVRTPDVMQIVDAMPLKQVGQDHIRMTTTVYYKQRSAGVVIYQPDAVLRIDKV